MSQQTAVRGGLFWSNARSGAGERVPDCVWSGDDDGKSGVGIGRYAPPAYPATADPLPETSGSYVHQDWM